MLGFISGIILAVWYRNQGPQEPVYEWLDEEYPSAEDPEDNETGKKDLV
jgi:hypothetical protein